MKTTQKNEEEKKIYHSPKLMKYGQLQELTAGGTGKQAEDMVNQQNKQRP